MSSDRGQLGLMPGVPRSPAFGRNSSLLSVPCYKSWGREAGDLYVSLVHLSLAKLTYTHGENPGLLRGFA